MGRWLLTRNPSGRLGDWRRSAFLVMFGLMHVIFGWSYIALPPTPTQLDALTVPLELAAQVGIGTGGALTIAGAIWICNGLFAGFAAIVPPGHDWWGFVALASLQAAWATAYLLSFFMVDNPRGIASAAYFLAFMFAVLLMSGMVSADRVSNEGKALALLPLPVEPVQIVEAVEPTADVPDAAEHDEDEGTTERS